LHWAFRDERVRFLIVGALNTVVGYSLFVLFELIIGQYTSYYVSLIASFFLATAFAFTVHRRYTFRIRGSERVIGDFIKFQGVNLGAFAVNLVALPILVELAGLMPIVAQAIVVVLTTVVSYVGHKYISFRRAHTRGRETRSHSVLESSGDAVEDGLVGGDVDGGR
jgi:putative flippase GtrA